MVSGKYSALSGAIAREQSIANTSNNLANINTTGYKKSLVSFESILNGEKQTPAAKGINYSRIRQNYSDFSPGAIHQTGDPLNMVIHGEGFFKVQGPDGIQYTRRGDFTVTAEGLLTTNKGLPVLNEGNGPITIPSIFDTDYNKVAVGDDGTIFVLDEEDAREEVDKLGIVEIPDKMQLRREKDTLFSLKEGVVTIPSENHRVIQGSLELSNVNMAAEMTQMIDSYRTFETYHKVLKSYSTISEMQDELGTLG